MQRQDEKNERRAKRESIYRIYICEREEKKIKAKKPLLKSSGRRDD